MRVAVHVLQQREIISFLQEQLRRHLAAMLLFWLSIVALAAFAWMRPLSAPPPLAVALVQSSSTTGSSFFVGNGLFVTSARVVGADKEVTLRLPQGAAFTAQVQFSDLESDVAVLRASAVDPTLAPLPLGDAASLSDGEPVQVAGYVADVYALTPMTIVRRAEGALELSVEGTPGESGGPVIRTSDQTVVGMVVSRLGGTNTRQQALPINTIEAVSRTKRFPIR